MRLLSGSVSGNIGIKYVSFSIGFWGLDLMPLVLWMGSDVRGGIMNTTYGKGKKMESRGDLTL